MASQRKTPTKKTVLWTTAIFMIFVAIGLAFIFRPKLASKPPTSPKGTYVAPQFKSQGELTLQRTDGTKTHVLEMEIADNPDERQTGMMKREKMDDNQAMLFIFDNEIIRSFWMSNTLVSLDIIFVNSNQEIVSIEKNAIPYDKSHYWSAEPARFVVEVVGGFCDEYNITSGDKVTWIRTDKF
ncbi:MAG: DUF192 domain-containing protein [candidate division Zixibacteria bacterium]|nr:DUF192 domain-containing protein [candidate division Zixibacteria bacterium]